MKLKVTLVAQNYSRWKLKAKLFPPTCSPSRVHLSRFWLGDQWKAPVVSSISFSSTPGKPKFIFCSYVELTWTSTRTIHLKCPVQQIRIGTLSLGPLVLVVCLLLLLMEVASSSSSFHSSLLEWSCSNIDGNRVLIPRRDSTATHLSPPGDLLPTPASSNSADLAVSFLQS